MQQDTKLENHDTDDLSERRVDDADGRLFEQRNLCVAPGSLFRVGGVGVAFGTVCGHASHTVTVRVVLDANGGELGCAPAEGDQFDDEDHEYTNESDGEGVGLCRRVS